MGVHKLPTAAAHAIKQNASVQEIDMEKLKSRLLKDQQILHQTKR